MKKIIALAASAALIGGGLAVTTSTAAEAAPNDLVIKNSTKSQTALKVCRSLVSPTQCSSSPGSVRYLPPGQNTKTRFGWADTDAIILLSGQRARVKGSVITWSGPRLIKRSGQFGLTTTIVLTKR